MQRRRRGQHREQAKTPAIFALSDRRVDDDQPQPHPQTSSIADDSTLCISPCSESKTRHGMAGWMTLDCVDVCLESMRDLLMPTETFESHKSYGLLNCLVLVQRRMEHVEQLYDVEPREDEMWKILRCFAQKLTSVCTNSPRAIHIKWLGVWTSV